MREERINARRAERSERKERHREEYFNNKSMTKKENDYPRFVKFNGTVLRRESDDIWCANYWCDNGDWGISAYIEMGINGPILKSRKTDIFKENVRLYEATEKEWVEKVGEYLPSDVKLLDGHIWNGEYIENKLNNGKYSNNYTEIPLDDEYGISLTSPKNNKYKYLLIC